ncbi:MAG: hypothetical protein L0956_04575, partial [Candidatus Mariimomonas ferrooxydans]
MRLDKFTLKSQEAVEKAQQLAHKKGNQQVDIEHLLSVLLEEGIASEIIKMIGADVNALKNEIEAEIDRLPKVLGSTPVLHTTSTHHS